MIKRGCEAKPNLEQPRGRGQHFARREAEGTGSSRGRGGRGQGMQRIDYGLGSLLFLSFTLLSLVPLGLGDVFLQLFGLLQGPFVLEVRQLVGVKSGAEGLDVRPPGGVGRVGRVLFLALLVADGGGAKHDDESGLKACINIGGVSVMGH